MDHLRRSMIVLTALLCAAALGFVLLPLMIFFDPWLSGAGTSAVDTVADMLLGGDPARLEAAALFAWTGLVTICIIPITVVAIIAEAFWARHWVWYAVGTGGSAAALPLVFRLIIGGNDSTAERSATPVEHRLLLLFFVTGVAVGSVYWLIARRPAAENLGQRQS